MNMKLIAAILAVLFLAVWYEASLWKECRADHSWFYCARVLGH